MLHWRQTIDICTFLKHLNRILHLIINILSNVNPLILHVRDSHGFLNSIEKEYQNLLNQ